MKIFLQQKNIYITVFISYLINQSQFKEMAILKPEYE